MIDREFGLWRVLERVAARPNDTEPRYRCRCRCGGEKDLRGSTLRSGDSSSCGCQSIHLMKATYREKRIAATA